MGAKSAARRPAVKDATREPQIDEAHPSLPDCRRAERQQVLVRFLTLVLVLLVACSGGDGKQNSNNGGGEAPLGILVTPDALIVPIGSTVQLSATGLYKKRRTEDLTNVAKWRTSDENVATVGSGLDVEGLVTGIAVGSVDIWADVDGDKSPPALITVTDQALEALIVEPSELVVAVGQTVPMIASAQFSDGARSDATEQVRWITSDASIATFDGSVLTASGTGTTTIQAQWDDIISAPVPVDVLASASSDLRIQTLTAVGIDDTVSVTVQVENLGTAGAADFWIDVFVDPSGNLGPGDVGDDYARVNWVGPDEVVAVEIEITGVSDGDHEVVAVVDIEDEVDESNEGNNEASVDVTMSGGTDLLPANLAIDTVDWLADPSDVYYFVEISNYGDEGVGPFWVDVYVDEASAPAVGQDGDEWEQIPWIGPWQTIVVEFLVSESCVACDSWVQVDTWDEAAESDESDNLFGPELVYY